MISVATSLNDKQVEALAAYFGSLPKPTPKAAPKAAPKGGKK
jgi:cytochrome c553